MTIGLYEKFDLNLRAKNCLQSETVPFSSQPIATTVHFGQNFLRTEIGQGWARAGSRNILKWNQEPGFFWEIFRGFRAWSQNPAGAHPWDRVAYRKIRNFRKKSEDSKKKDIKNLFRAIKVSLWFYKKWQKLNRYPKQSVEWRLNYFLSALQCWKGGREHQIGGVRFQERVERWDGVVVRGGFFTK